MYTFRLGIVTTLLSETLVNSFTTAAAVYVFISQIKDLLGLKLPKQKGYFKLIFVSKYKNSVCVYIYMFIYICV